MKHNETMTLTTVTHLLRRHEWRAVRTLHYTGLQKSNFIPSNPLSRARSDGPHRSDGAPRTRRLEPSVELDHIIQPGIAVEVSMSIGSNALAWVPTTPHGIAETA